GSGLCVDASGYGTSNGTAIQQYACANGSNSTQTNQEWIFQSAGNGVYYVQDDAATGETWNVVDPGSYGSGSDMQLYAYYGQGNETFTAVAASGGYYEFVNTGSGDCLAVPGNSTSNGVQLEIYTCNGGPSQLWKLVTP
ncbi:MAG: RICIN domain-containing protein, partial [Terracidiphilus sp.]